MKKPPLSLWPHKTLRPVDTIAHIQAQVAERHGMTVREMLEDTRARPVARARQESMWTCRQILKDGKPRYSMFYIAVRHNLTNHSTVDYAIKRFEERMQHGREAA